MASGRRSTLSGPAWGGWWSRVRELAFNPHAWVVALSLILIGVLHYVCPRCPHLLNVLLPDMPAPLSRHSFERILAIFPAVYAGFIFGLRGGLFTLMLGLAIMLPRALFISSYPMDATLETLVTTVVGGVVIWMVEVQERERRLRERMLAEMEMLNSISTAAVQSLEPGEVLKRSLQGIAEAMGVEMAWVFLLDEEAGELYLGGQYGVPEGLQLGVDRLKVGEGLSGRVAETGEPIVLENLSADPRLTREAVRRYGVKGFLAVPLRSKGKIIGTLDLGTYGIRRFNPNQVRLLSTIANQIGVVVENARLYQQALAYTAQLKASEEAYRTLFENASDAIVLIDLEGRFLAANRAFQKLTGYGYPELQERKVGELFPEEDRVRLPDASQGGEQGAWGTRLMTKEGEERIVELAAGPITEEGKAKGFQYIVRDVTERQRMQDNMRSYVEQVTRVQEAERLRIARELHDDTAQALMLLSRRLSVLADRAGEVPADVREGQEGAYEMANTILRGIRRIIQDLRPSTLDHLGLIPALRELTTQVLAEGGIGASFEVVGEERRLSPEVELALFRIAQEALNNIRRHSGAREATIRVEFGGAETLVAIADNGRGFAMPRRVGDLAAQGKLGLMGMYERARLVGGKLAIHSEPGKGSQVEVRVPNSFPPASEAVGTS